MQATLDANTIPPAEAIMQPLGFDQDDLSANREGKLSERQQDELRRLQTRTLLIGAGGFMGFALVATIFLFFGSGDALWLLTFLGIFVTILNALFVGMLARQWMRLRADMDSGTITTLEGELERVVLPDRRANNLILRIEGEDFHVKKTVFQQFRHEVAYRVYRTTHSRVLLSAEPNP
ncbi:MAG: hypothetical protein AAFR81_14180 [Chloroflexota bacterium]